MNDRAAVSAGPVPQRAFAGTRPRAKAVDRAHPGTTRLHPLEENIGAVNLQLSPKDLRELETAASKIAVQGARYIEELQKLVGR